MCGSKCRHRCLSFNTNQIEDTASPPPIFVTGTHASGTLNTSLESRNWHTAICQETQHVLLGSERSGLAALACEGCTITRNSQRQMTRFFSQGDDVISSYLSLEQTRMQVPKIWPLGQCAASSAWFSCQMLPALSISGAAVCLLCDAVFKERGCLLWRRLMRNEQPLLNHLPHRGGSHSSCTATKPPSSLSPFTALSLTRLFSSVRSAADYRPWNIGNWVAGPGRGGGSRKFGWLMRSAHLHLVCAQLQTGGHWNSEPFGGQSPIRPGVRSRFPPLK